MGRRRKTSPLEDFLDLVASLPWWAGVALAAVLYVVLHSIASQPVAMNVSPGQIGASVSQSIFRSVAAAFQYILPPRCLVGAGVSAWRRRERRALVADVAHSGAADVLDGMTWQRFELLVGEAFRLQGYAVAETGGGGADGGVDLVLTKGSEKFFVQCKQWKAYRVSVNVVRELYGVMAAKGAAGGYVVTSGRFTDEAMEFASGRNIKLVDGPRLRIIIRQVQQAAHRSGEVHVEPSPSLQSSPPSCPTCSRLMVRRTSRRGANEGG